MLNPQDSSSFVHPSHVAMFVSAAQTFQCHILVRKTGRASLSWVCKRGYTGKRADLKAKTANLDLGSRQLAGLVCSPHLLPQAFTADRLPSAMKKWGECAHLITTPRDSVGFEDDRQPTGCRTPYLVQTRPTHKHYGCVALVDMGLLVPRYVHGDYDLYAIIPAGHPFDPNAVQVRHSRLGSSMAPDSLTLQERAQLDVPNMDGPLTFRIANYINGRIEASAPDLLGALMVNHGEQVNIGQPGQTFEPVLAIMAKQVNGQWGKILSTRDEHERFYRDA